VADSREFLLDVVASNDQDRPGFLALLTPARRKGTIFHDGIDPVCARRGESRRFWRLGTRKFVESVYAWVEFIVLLRRSFPDLAKVRVFRPQRMADRPKVIPVNVQEVDCRWSPGA